MVDGARQHACELGLAKPRLEPLDLSLGVADGRLIVLGRAELE